MWLDPYHNRDNNEVTFTRDQASAFAKSIAGDFNPIHDPGARRFCVPGDLLFAVVLQRYGLSQKMKFTFSGMVGSGVQLVLPDSDAACVSIRDGRDKEYLTLEREGKTTTDKDLIARLSRSYVAFSGQTFPKILVPLMKRHEVMINPDRPLVIYESMAIELDRLDIGDVSLDLSESTLEVEGKRGEARLHFTLSSDGNTVGQGEKSIALGGLRGYEDAGIDQLVDEYNGRKQSYQP